MIKKDKILILGASGFIGSQVLKSFSESVDSYQVYAVEHNTKVTRYNSIEILHGSLSDVPKFIDSIKPTIIVHAARISGRNRLLGRKWASFRGGYINKKIYKKVAEHKCKLAYVSGSLMYGSHTNIKVTENFKLNPISFAKEYLKAEFPFVENRNRTAIMMLRPGWVFGDDSWYELFFNQVIKKFNYVPQYGEGQNCMSIIHVEDLGRMIKEYALRASYTRDYNLIGPINIPHYEFVKLLSKIHNKAIRSFSKEDVIRKFGQVIYDALSSDIHLATNYIDIVETFEYDYKRVDDLFN